MTDLIRSASLTHYAEIARSVGIDPKAMLKQARLPLHCLENPDLRIAVAGVRRLLEDSAKVSGAEEFGLRLAERGGFSTLGPVALVVREQATVGAAIEALARYIHIQDEAMRLEIDRRDDLVTIAMFLRGGHQRATRQSTELALGRVHRIIAMLFPEQWRPLEVHFAHAPPRRRTYHRKFFGCEVTFNSEFDAIVCHAVDMNRAISTAQPMLASYVESRIREIGPRPEAWDDKVRELVRALLPGGNCTIETIAEHLGCDRRTIHRRLRECSTTFSAILDAERSDIAMRLVEDGNRPLKEIAELLGFSAQSALARWFRGRFGCSITGWRGSNRQRTLTAAARW
jgi:AraC-like DNA-binding protein